VRAQQGVGHYLESLAVDATDPDGTWSVHPLVGGNQYQLQVAGTFTYGQGDSAADAECSQLKPDPGWQPNRYVAMTSYEDLLDLYLDSSAVNWSAEDADALGCNTFNHTYSYRFVMPETRNIRLYIRDIDGSYYENSGALVVRIEQIEGDAPTAPPAASQPPAAGAAPATAPVGAALAPVRPPAPGHNPASSAPSPAQVPEAVTAGDEVAMGSSGITPVVPLPVSLPDPPPPGRELATLLAVAAWGAVLSNVARRVRIVVLPRRSVSR
jgi:hypothetical protein